MQKNIIKYKNIANIYIKFETFRVIRNLRNNTHHSKKNVIEINGEK